MSFLFPQFRIPQEEIGFETVRPTVNIPTGPVFVEVGGEAVEANITREGVKVPSLTIDPVVLTGILDVLPGVPRLKVVSQSVESGRAVERGTIVNLVLAQPIDLPILIVDGVLEQLAGRTVGQVFNDFVATQPQIRQILMTRSEPSQLTGGDKEAIVNVMAQAGISVDITDDQAVAGAFTGLQAANTFGS